MKGHRFALSSFGILFGVVFFTGEPAMETTPNLTPESQVARLAAVILAVADERHYYMRRLAAKRAGSTGCIQS
ncbi:hypothetical protein C4Q26_19935 [Pseudomonas sp. SWI44]|nr:hypothetical protein PVLB_17035 [Pseudomonas sp. VLB120]AVD89284.1 hypothetical protein C4Q26_19935 [Pseudomonas sp. SWI44]